ncbi:helix-turn-helix domain-containing protein [Aquimarina agarivorans]|uniref:helix-turn-helix domain-containing protein n=1 Tax=Aquimarina agarivorans TaxID=980584 RepID=UPI000248EA36|nr:helix-turn-helix domain-containing protein [Aquimarina agarivorans]
MHPLKFVFNRQTTFKHKFDGQNEVHEIKRLECAITSSNQINVHEFIIPENEPICIFSLEINRKKFEKSIEKFIPDMDDDLVTLFRDVNGVNQFYHKSQYSIQIAELINEFTDCELEGFMRNVFLESKAQEILVLTLKQYLGNLSEPEKQKILRQSTIKSIKKATKIIKKELSDISNVAKLANEVGLSSNTLQQGFKALFELSVNDYIRNYRIEKAKELIETSGMNIT